MSIPMDRRTKGKTLNRRLWCICFFINVLPKHYNLTSYFIANVMYVEIVEDREAQHIILTIEQRYKYKISFAKA